MMIMQTCCGGASNTPSADGACLGTFEPLLSRNGSIYTVIHRIHTEILPVNSPYAASGSNLEAS